MSKNKKAAKFDGGKVEYHLLPSRSLDAIAEVMKVGATKYGDYNWATGKGIAWSRYFNACLRHLWAFWRGKDYDEESGQSHLAHAGACVLILLEMVLLRKGNNNRPNYYSEKDQEQK